MLLRHASSRAIIMARQARKSFEAECSPIMESLKSLKNGSRRSGNSSELTRSAWEPDSNETPETSWANEFRIRLTKCNDFAKSGVINPSRYAELIRALKVASGESPSNSSSLEDSEGSSRRSKTWASSESSFAAPRMTAARSDSFLNSSTTCM